MAHANNVLHFAIHADNLERARAFYEQVFGWRFEAWGPPDFYRVHTGTTDDPGIAGALQKRQAELLNRSSTGFTCTVTTRNEPSQTTADRSPTRARSPRSAGSSPSKTPKATSCVPCNTSRKPSRTSGEATSYS